MRTENMHPHFMNFKEYLNITQMQQFIKTNFYPHIHDKTFKEYKNLQKVGKDTQYEVYNFTFSPSTFLFLLFFLKPRSFLMRNQMQERRCILFFQEELQVAGFDKVVPPSQYPEKVQNTLLAYWKKMIQKKDE